MNELNNNQESWDFIIVGAGICGLSLASLLSNDGYRVLVLEKSQKIGGRAQVVEKSGHILDYGIHVVRFGRKSAIAKTLEAIRDPSQEPIKFHALGISYYFLEKMENEEGELPRWEVFPSGLKEIRKGKYFKFSKIITVFLKLILSKTKKTLSVSVKDWVEAKNFNHMQNRYLKLITSSMQVCPYLERASLGELKRNILEVGKKRISATYPIGGWKLIYERILKKINSNGKILTNKEVKKVLVGSIDGINTVTGVKTDNEEYSAPRVILALPVQQIPDVLDKKFIETETYNQFKNTRPTAGISIDFCLKNKIHDGIGLFFVEEPIGFGFIPSNLDEGASPKDKQYLSMFFPCNHKELDDENFRKDLLERARNKIFKAFPNLEQNIEFERPLFLKMVDGVEVNTEQYRELRPKSTALKIHNLFLVGDSVGGSGAGGDIGHESVWETYKKIKIGLK